MILQVCADFRSVVINRNAKLFQRVRRTNAGKHQHLRRTESARRQNHSARRECFFNSILKHGYTSRSPVRNFDAQHLSLPNHFQVCALHRRFQVSVESAEALTVFVRKLRQPSAFKSVAVVMRLISQACGARRRHKRLRQLMSVFVRRNHHRAAATARAVGFFAQPTFLFAKRRRDFFPAPAGSARRRPFVEIRRMTPLMNLSVHVRRTAQHLSARREDAPTIGGGLWLAFEIPIQLALE